MTLGTEQNIPFELLEKTRPQQQRAIQTYERILESAAEILSEGGIEKVSTNVIAERAGITVPALYRYFPNKYAVLYTLGARLMDRQNEVMVSWFQQYESDHDPFKPIHHMYELFRDTLAVTREQTAGFTILKSMRVLPVLQEPRLQSHYAMTDWICDKIAQPLGEDIPEDMKVRIRLIMELGTSAMEMAVDDPKMDEDTALREAGKMVEVYWMDYLASLSI